MGCPKEAVIATASHGGSVNMWSVATRSRKAKLPISGDAAGEAVFSPDGKSLAIAVDDMCQIWDVDSASLRINIGRLPDIVWGICFASTSQAVLAFGGESTVQLRNVQTSDCIMAFEGHGNRVNSAIFSPDGKLLATGSCDGTSKIWDVSAGACQATLSDGTNESQTVISFSSDGESLLSAGFAKACVWDVVTGNCKLALDGNFGGTGVID